MNAMNTRNGTLSPVSTTDSQEWSPITRYQNIAGDNPYSPTIPPNTYGPSNTDGGMLNGMHPGTGNGNPSPPSSVGRSSDGTGLYASSMSDSTRGLLDSRKMAALEETMSEHFRVLKAYLGPYLNDEKGNPRPSRAKDKLTRLSAVQFQELSTDVFDESIRREQDRKRGGPGAPGNETPKYLLPKNNFHPKRNQARQKLSTLPLERFRQLATDVFYELERRFPRFTSGEMPPRSASPATSIASRISNRGPPSRGGTPNSMGGRPPPGPGYRGPPPMGGPIGGPMGGPPGGPPGPPGMLRPGSNDSNSFGRPLPKTFQSNTIVPNKGTLVEDDDDSAADDDDAFNLEGAAARRQTNKSAKSMSMAHEKMTADLQNQVSELQGKVESLESTLRGKDEELQQLRDADQMRNGNLASERAEWDELRLSLEEKVEKAEDLNSSLRSEIDRLRSENEGVEISLRAQIVDLKSRPQQAFDNGDGEWRQRCEELEQELSEQQQVAEEVRRDASTFLQEMKELSARSDAAAEKEEQMAHKVSSLETELKDWKSRYAKAKTQLRNLKASSMGLSQLMSPDLGNYTRDASFTSPDGVVKDVHVTKFQLSIDELLQIARRANSEQTLESMRHVVKCVRAITGDIDSTSSLSQMQSPTSSVSGDILANPEKQQAKLKSRVSATANNLITATKNHASSSGLSPVSLLDAAASHLSTAVVELVKYVKVRPTPEDELEDDDDEDNDRPMPLKPTVYSAYDAHPPSNTNSNSSNATPPYGHQRGRSSKGGSSDTTRYSAYSSPYSGYDNRQSAGMSGTNGVNGSGMLEFKVCSKSRA
jgi:predicted  nucleic acid-binding Zn-ribbon protein